MENKDAKNGVPVSQSTSNDWSGPKDRYSSTEEFRKEFGSYRVNENTNNLSDSAKKTDVANNMRDGEYTSCQTEEMLDSESENNPYGKDSVGVNDTNEEE